MGLFLGVGGVQAKTTLTLSGWNQPLMDGYWKPMVEKFSQEYPDIQIDFLVKPVGQYYNAILTMLAAGAGPDLIISNPQNSPTFITKGLWYNLDNLIKRDKFSFANYLEPAWAYCRYNGSYYGWPAGDNPGFPNLGIAYNKDMIAVAGLAEPKATWTFKDFLDYLKKLTVDQNKDDKPEVWGINELGIAWYWDWIWSNGGQVLSESRKQLLVTEPAAVEGLQFMVDVNTKYGVSARGGRNLFKSSQAAMANINLAMVTEMRAANLNFDWGMLPYPRGKAGIDHGQRAGDLPVGINKDSKNVEEAWTFLKWMVREDVQRWAVEQGILAAPSHRKVVLSSKYLKPVQPPYDLMPFVEQPARTLPVFPYWDEFDTALTAAINKAHTGNISVAGALEEQKPKMLETLSRSW
jgi:multiple sugar transport system substrate-binding protein